MPKFTIHLRRIDSTGERVPDYPNPEPAVIDAKTSTLAIALAIQAAPDDALWDADAERWQNPDDLGDITPTLTELEAAQEAPNADTPE